MTRRGPDTTRRGRFLARLTREDGFTLIEILAASLVLAIGIGALTTILISSRKVVNDSERREAATAVAEQAIEDVQAMPFAQIGLSSPPTNGTTLDPYEPDYYVNGPNYRPDHRNPSAPPEPLVMTGTLPPTESWSDGRLSGTVHHYVTETTLAPASALKRITVAVTVSGGQSKIKPVVVSSMVSR